MRNKFSCSYNKNLNEKLDRNVSPLGCALEWGSFFVQVKQLLNARFKITSFTSNIINSVTRETAFDLLQKVARTWNWAEGGSSITLFCMVQ